MLRNARLLDLERENFVEVVKEMRQSFESPLFYVGG